ncbi:MAG: hypothetical protein COB50_05120 [Thiotrichales bacterium]|nr:MAG: hypothetical protein COB50_05120 [Thiotrichales bacterium]
MSNQIENLITILASIIDRRVEELELKMRKLFSQPPNDIAIKSIEKYIHQQSLHKGLLLLLANNFSDEEECIKITQRNLLGNLGDKINTLIEKQLSKYISVKYKVIHKKLLSVYLEQVPLHVNLNNIDVILDKMKIKKDNLKIDYAETLKVRAKLQMQVSSSTYDNISKYKLVATEIKDFIEIMMQLSDLQHTYYDDSIELDIKSMDELEENILDNMKILTSNVKQCSSNAVNATYVLQSAKDTLTKLNDITNKEGYDGFDDKYKQKIAVWIKSATEQIKIYIKALANDEKVLQQQEKSLYACSLQKELWNVFMGICPQLVAEYNKKYRDSNKKLFQFDEKTAVEDGILVQQAVVTGMVQDLMDLLNNGASLDIRDKYNCTVFHIAVESPKNTYMLENLLDLNETVDLNAKCDDGGYTALMMAACQNDILAIELLIDFGATVNLQDDDGNTAMHHAAMAGNFDAAKLLYIFEGSIDVKNNLGKTAEYWLSKYGIKSKIMVNKV